MSEENKQILKTQLERDGGPLGENHQAMDILIRLTEKMSTHELEEIRDIARYITLLKPMSPIQNFTLFSHEKDTFFMVNFNALQLCSKSDDYTNFHELGHALHSIINGRNLPEDTEQTITGAKNYSLTTKKEDFLDYLIYLCNRDNTDRTKGEKGPLSDIISSIHMYPRVTLLSRGNITLTLPAFHRREYYYDIEKDTPKFDVIFDEGFANFFSLIVNGCTKELETLRNIYGDAYIDMMYNYLELLVKKLKEYSIQVGNEKEVKTIG